MTGILCLSGKDICTSLIIMAEKRRKLSISIPNEWINRRPRFVNAGRLIFDSAISPTGKRAVFNARGEIVTVPSDKGDIRNLTRTPCKMEPPSGLVSRWKMDRLFRRA